MVLDDSIESIHNLFKTPAFDFVDDALKKECLSLNEWPDIDSYNKLFHQSPFPFTKQDTNAVKVHGGYLGYIDRFKEIPTRLENVHDFMNAMSWHCYPQSKMCLQQLQLQYDRDKVAGNNRSSQQNAYTLFDESGIILISNDPQFIELIKNHQWNDLFWNQRQELIANTKIICFGHGLLEKLQEPFIGLCGKIMWVEANPNIELDDLDQLIRKAIADQLHDTKDLSPFPILGWPDWRPQQDENFYNNTDYFRPLRQ